jgi:1,4-dihydroxy-6-naphthoate synthase
MELSLGYSTCPNDTFIFYALACGQIKLPGLSFSSYLTDVEELNKAASSEKYDIVKLSYHAYSKLWEKYQILSAGSALGRGNGPLLVAKTKMPSGKLACSTVAIPGENTTAALLLKIAYPQILKTKTMLFSDIENAVIAGDVEAGLLIHENRFTYSSKGLIKIADLGEFWEKEENMPIPLGCIAIKRSLPYEIKQTVQQALRSSVEFALENNQKPLHYMRRYAQEMDDKIMTDHVGLYVNSYTRDIGNEGKEAIERLFLRAFNIGAITSLPENCFL